jgi:hypothetical protein
VVQEVVEAEVVDRLLVAQELEAEHHLLEVDKVLYFSKTET